MGVADECHPTEWSLGGRMQIDISRLGSLLELSGALYVCAADPVGGGVLGELSRDGVSESDRSVGDAVVDWGRQVTAVPESPDVEDVMLTTDRSFHLLRQVTAPVAGGRVLVYFRLDSGRANLAMARRALAAVSLQDGPTSPGRPTETGARQRHLSVAQFPLPRRSPAPPESERAGAPEVQIVAAPPVLSRAWSTDVDVLRRLVDGLRRLT